MSTEHTLRLIGEFLTQGGYARGIDPDTLDREAVLVAAAPDLLAALEDLVKGNFGQPRGVTVPALDNARAAIALATGEDEI
jgi:hypothetical protein